MKKLGLLLIAAAGGAAALLFGHGPASASTLPAAWKPPAGARVQNFPMPIAGTGIKTLRRTEWDVPADSSGQQAGTFVLTQNAANPNDWVMGFRAASNGGFGILAYSQTPMGGMLAQAAAAGQ